MAKKLGYASYRISPLKRITAEAKRIKKSSPGKSWKSAVKEAGKKYRTGQLGAVKARKTAKPKRKPAKRTRKPVTTIVVRQVKAVKVGSRKRRRRSAAPKRRMAGTRRRVSGSGKKSNILPILLVAGAGFLLWKALGNKQQAPPPGAPPLVPTNNQVRNQQANDILQYAMAAGLTIDAITRLIKNLNSKGDADVNYYYNTIDSGGQIPPSLYA
jgi:hypothetical protein